MTPDPICEGSKNVYCHCYPVFKCEPAVAEAEGPSGEWTPVCDRCMQISFDVGIRVRKLQPRRAVYEGPASSYVNPNSPFGI